MKVDLEELERKARAATPGCWLSDASEADDGEVWSDEPYKLVAKIARAPIAGNAQHIAANSPEVTLALIRRIRELETTLYHAIDSRNSADPLDGWFAERELALHVIEKGVVLP